MCPQLKRCQYIFRKNPTVISPVQINDQAVEFVLQYKNLGTVLDDMFYVNAVCRKANQRMHSYYQLLCFNVDST